MMYHHTNFELPNAFHKNYNEGKLVKCQRSFPLVLRMVAVKQTPKMPKLKFRYNKAKMENDVYLFA